MRKKYLTACIFMLALLMLAGFACAERVELPWRLETVRAGAFEGSGAVTEVILPDGIRRIESRAFAESALRVIRLNANLEYIAPDAFSGCEELQAECPENCYAYNYCVENGIEIVQPALVVRIAQSEDLQSYQIEVRDTLYESLESLAGQQGRRIRIYHSYVAEDLSGWLNEAAVKGADLVMADLPDADKAAEFVRKTSQAGIPCLLFKTEPSAAAVAGQDAIYVGASSGHVPVAAEMAQACARIGMNRMISGKWLEGLDDVSLDGWSVRLKDAPVLTGVKIGIDPGHQKKSNSEKEAIAPGSSTKKAKVSSGTRGVETGDAEYVRNLEISLKLKAVLVEMGAEVYMTRETHNVDISNKQRALMMNDLGVDLVLRIHCNGASVQSAKGIELYVTETGPIAKESKKAADKILPAMISATGAKNRGVKKSDSYTMNNWCTVPCILVECGFMTNPDEDLNLAKPKYQQKLAEGMAEGIRKYMGK